MMDTCPTPFRWGNEMGNRWVGGWGDDAEARSQQLVGGGWRGWMNPVDLSPWLRRRRRRRPRQAGLLLGFQPASPPSAQAAGVLALQGLPPPWDHPAAPGRGSPSRHTARSEQRLSLALLVCPPLPPSPPGRAACLPGAGLGASLGPAGLTCRLQPKARPAQPRPAALVSSPWLRRSSCSSISLVGRLSRKEAARSSES